MRWSPTTSRARSCSRSPSPRTSTSTRSWSGRPRRPTEPPDHVARHERRLLLELHGAVALDVEAGGSHAHLVAPVALDLRPRAVVVAPVELDDQLLLPPDRVDQNSGDQDVDVVRQRYPELLAQRQEEALERAARAGELRLVPRQGVPQLRAASTAITGNHLECGEVEHLVIVGVGQGESDPFDGRGGRVVEQRLLDGGGRQAPMKYALALPPTVHADPRLLLAATRRSHLERAWLLVDQAAPPERGGVAEHRAGARVEHRRPQVGLDAAAHVSNGIHPGTDRVQVSALGPPSDHAPINAERRELRCAYSPRLTLRQVSDSGADVAHSSTQTPKIHVGRRIRPPV